MFNVLWQHLCSFSSKWTLYQTLFARPEDIALLNATAPGAFLLIETSLRNDMVTTIGRLTDPPATGSLENISFARLIQSLKGRCPDDLCARLKSDLDAAHEHVTPFKAIRNKTVGHIDLRTALATTPDLTMAVSRGHVETALTMLADLMNAVSTHFARSSSVFDDVIMHGDGKHLLFYLKAAKEHFAEEERVERLRVTGKPSLSKQPGPTHEP